MKRLIITILPSLLLLSSINSQQVTKIRIDPAQAYGGEVSAYFSSVEYIPLETNRESLFGDIGQLCVTDSGFVIADYDTRVVLFFDIDGKYITKIKFSNDEIPNIIYSKHKQNVIISVYKISRATLTNVICNLQGQILSKSEKLSRLGNNKFQYQLGGDWFFELNDCHVYSKKEVRDSLVPLVSIFRKDTLKKSFLPVSSKRDLGFCMLAGSLIVSKSQQDGSFYACLPIENYVYEITRDTVRGLFQFVFPQSRSYNPDLLQSNNMSYLDSAINKDKRDPKKIYAVTNIFFKKNLLFFKIMAQVYYTSSSSSESELQYNFIYDTLTKKLVSIERLSPDITSFFLPIRGNLAINEGFIFNNSNLYSAISSLNLFAEREATKFRNPQYPPVLQKYFKTQNRKSNPVIVKMKLKE